MTTEHAELIAPRSLEHREWVCAIDLNGDSKRVLDLANRPAAAAGARLSLIHVIQPSGSAAQDGGDEEKARQCIGELQNSIGGEAMLRVIRGPMREAVLDAAQQSGADVLIIGRPRSKALWSYARFHLRCSSGFTVPHAQCVMSQFLEKSYVEPE